MPITSSPLARLMKHSPFKGMQEHMQVVLECVRHVPAVIDAQCRNDREALKMTRDEIFRREDEADKLKNALRANLPRSLFMPVDRRDLLDILQVQDDIADTAQDIAGLLFERPIDIPIALQEPLRSLTQRCVDTCEHAGRIINELDELVATGFRGREAAQVEAMLNELNAIEDETDRKGIELSRMLFAHEDEMNPVSVILFYRLIEWIGDLADYAEKVGDRLRLLIAR